MAKNDNFIMKQYLNSQVNLNDLKTAPSQDGLTSVKSVNTQEEEAHKEYEKFKKKLKQLDGIDTISEAKRIAKEFLPLDKGKTCLKVGDAKCVIISRGDLFRVCLDSEKEYICYNIIKQ